MAITAVTGPIGGGKTLYVVRKARAAAARRPAVIVSNIYIKPPDGGLLIELEMGSAWGETLVTTVMKVLDGEIVLPDGRVAAGVEIVIDEFGLVCNSRDWRGMPFEVVWLAAQSRKVHANLWLTAQFFEMLDAAIRAIVTEVVVVRALPRPTVARREAGKRPFLMRAKWYQAGKAGNRDFEIDSETYLYRREWEGWYDTDRVVWPARLAEFRARIEGLKPGQSLDRSKESDSGTVSD